MVGTPGLWRYDDVSQNNKVFWKWIQITYWCLQAWFVCYKHPAFVYNAHLFIKCTYTLLCIKISWKTQKVIHIVGNAKSIICSLHKLSQLMFCTAIRIFNVWTLYNALSQVYFEQKSSISQKSLLFPQVVLFFLLLLLSSPICVNRLGWTFTSGGSILYIHLIQSFSTSMNTVIGKMKLKWKSTYSNFFFLFFLSSDTAIASAYQLLSVHSPSVSIMNFFKDVSFFSPFWTPLILLNRLCLLL